MDGDSSADSDYYDVSTDEDLEFDAHYCDRRDSKPAAAPLASSPYSFNLAFSFTLQKIRAQLEGNELVAFDMRDVDAIRACFASIQPCINSHSASAPIAYSSILDAADFLWHWSEEHRPATKAVDPTSMHLDSAAYREFEFAVGKMRNEVDYVNATVPTMVLAYLQQSAGVRSIVTHVRWPSIQRERAPGTGGFGQRPKSRLASSRRRVEDGVAKSMRDSAESVARLVSASQTAAAAALPPVAPWPSDDAYRHTLLKIERHGYDIASCPVAFDQRDNDAVRAHFVAVQSCIASRIATAPMAYFELVKAAEFLWDWSCSHRPKCGSVDPKSMHGDCAAYDEYADDTARLFDQVWSDGDAKAAAVESLRELLAATDSDAARASLRDVDSIAAAASLAASSSAAFWSSSSSSSSAAASASPSPDSAPVAIARTLSIVDKKRSAASSIDRADCKSQRTCAASSASGSCAAAPPSDSPAAADAAAAASTLPNASVSSSPRITAAPLAERPSSLADEHRLLQARYERLKIKKSRHTLMCEQRVASYETMARAFAVVREQNSKMKQALTAASSSLSQTVSAIARF
jgi:hypothetical protein